LMVDVLAETLSGSAGGPLSPVEPEPENGHACGSNARQLPQI
jgi:hypothetical protein